MREDCYKPPPPLISIDTGNVGYTTHIDDPSPKYRNQNCGGGLCLLSSRGKNENCPLNTLAIMTSFVFGAQWHFLCHYHC